MLKLDDENSTALQEDRLAKLETQYWNSVLI